MASPDKKYKTRQKYTPEVEMGMWEFFLKKLRRNNPQAIETRYTLWQEYEKLHAERSWQSYDSHFRRKMLPRLDRYALDKEDKLLVLKKCRVTLDQRQVQKKDLERALNCQLQVDAKGNVLSCVTPEDHAEQDARDEDDGSDTDDEIERMVQEAEKYKAEDEGQRDRVAAKNNLESYCFNMKQTIEDEKLKDKISEDDRKKVQDKCTETLAWLDANQTAEKEEFEHHQKELEGVCNPIVTELHASAGGAPGGMPGGASGGRKRKLGNVPGVLYTCDLFDESSALPKAEMIERVEQHLRSQLNGEGVEAAVIMIYSLNSAAKYEAAVDTMKKYLQNIADNPEEPKFRRIRLSNKVFSKKVAVVKGAVEFLRAVGFNDVDVPSENGAVEKYLAFPETTPDHVENLRESLLSLESGSGVSLKVFRDPKVFRFDPSRPIPKPHIPSDFVDLTTAEAKREQQQEGLSRQNYKYTLIRVRFPNNYILQGVFGVHEQLDALREFVCKFLEYNFGVFFINDGGVRIDDGKKTLGEYGLAPAAVLHCEWDEETSAQFRSLGKPPTYLASATEVQADHLT